MNLLYERILDISYKLELSHLSSCLSAVGIIDEIYQKKEKDEPFILSNGHAGLALYCVLEKYQSVDAEYLYKKHGTHPNFDKENRIWASTGSLGHGIGIALGYALADRSRMVYCLISDGESYEGSVYEALNIRDKFNVDNLEVHMNYNGFCAYDDVSENHIKQFKDRVIIHDTQDKLPPFLRAISGHYVKLDKKAYKEAREYYRN